MMKACIFGVIWVWWTAMVGTTLGYDVVKFSIMGATGDSYASFIETLRIQLASGKERYEIPLLRSSTAVLSSEQRFLFVELSDEAGQTITLALDVSNAFFVGYKANDHSFLCLDAPDDPFPDTSPMSFVFSCTYQDLESHGHQRRADIPLGIWHLNDAIMALYQNKETDPLPEVARYIVVIAQMVSEAARFRYIEHGVRSSIVANQDFSPNNAILSLEDNWSSLATAIQNSNQGVFSKPIQLQRADNSAFGVDSVTRILIANLALMEFECEDQASQLFSSLVIMSVVDNEICDIPEPTIRISGRNGLCVDVKDGNYNDGDAIQSWPCKSNSDVNQLWTLKRDGTIQSNNKCLTASSPFQGSHIVIYTCSNPPIPQTNIWKLWTDGSITKPPSNLKLSAESGNSGTTLTLQSDITTHQGWLASKNTEPFVTSIAWFEYPYCMYTDDSSVGVEKCASEKAEQKWAFYPDGSIRIQQSEDKCLTSENHSQGAKIIIDICELGLSNQRWVFRNDGTILNLLDGFVMEVQNSEIVLSNFIAGTRSQIWYALL